MDKAKDKETSAYECAICIETAKEPVVTKCGHIFCWPCIYNWLEAKGVSAKCPNCKNPISKENWIPIYNKEQNEKNTKRFENIPNRPQGERSKENTERESTGNNFNFSFGFFSPFGFGMNFGNIGHGFNNGILQPNLNNLFPGFERLPENSKKAIRQLLILFMMIYIYMMFFN